MYWRSQKIALSNYDDQRIQSIDSIKTFAYGKRKEQIFKKAEIKCSNYNKTTQEWLTLMILQDKIYLKLFKWQKLFKC